ncbi:La- protein 4, partial [Dissophora globulifera]
MAAEGVYSVRQPHQPFERFPTKSNASVKGLRQPGHDAFFQHTGLPRTPHDRSQMGSPQGGDHQIKSGNHRLNYNNQRDVNSSISNNTSKAPRAGNHQQNHHHSAGDYKRQDYAAENSSSNYHRSSLTPASKTRRRHTNDSGAMLNNTQPRYSTLQHHQSGSRSHSSVPLMPRSLSYESSIPHAVRYNAQGYQHFLAQAAQPQIIVNETFHPTLYAPQHHTRRHQATAEHIDESYTPQRPRALSNSGTETLLESVYPPQPFYGMQWGYRPSQMPPVTPLAQEAASEGQRDAKEMLESLPSQIATLSLDARAYGDQEYRCERLREQLEWYFSPRNLATDTYLVSKMNADQWVPISVVADFNKVKAITHEFQDVVDALRKSPKVLVDTDGKMAKAITVDRPRTTLILRELPEDAEEQDIRGVFTEANCPAKSITKESVGNMWFVEFETADDALAMLHYTRGRYLLDVPIAARLKSNTVFTSGEFKSTQMATTTSGNLVMTATPATQDWVQPPSPSMAQDGLVFGMPAPYRRFPADETLVAPDSWSNQPIQESSPHDTSRSQTASPPFPPEAFHPLGVMAPTAVVLPPNAYYINGQMWIAAPGFAMPPPQGVDVHQHYPGQVFLHPTQYGARFAREARRDSQSDSCSQSGGGRSSDFMNRRASRQDYDDGAGGMRYSRHRNYYGLIDAQGQFQHANASYNMGQHPMRSDRSSDSRSDMSSGHPMQTKSGKKKRKNGFKNRNRNYYPRRGSNGQKSQNVVQAAGTDGADFSGISLNASLLVTESNPLGIEDGTKELEQSQVASVNAGVAMLTT